jgi:uncharacterized protein involved in outer membrane biogenesis
MTSLPESPSKRWRRWVLSAGAVPVLVVGACFAIVDSEYGHRAFIQHLASSSGRDIQVRGRMQMHLLTPSPSLVWEQVTIGNPPWTRPGTLARIDKLALTFDFPLPWRKAKIRRLEMQGASLDLVRDAEGRGNWFSNPPGRKSSGRGRLIRSIEVRDARIVLHDERRHLDFDGVVSVSDEDGAANAGAAASNAMLQIRARGQLNGQPVALAINSDPLATASYERPYRFAFNEQSAGSHLVGRGSLHKPFSFDELDISFDAAGTSLHDLYYLVGVTLPNTAPFTLTGKMTRDRTRFVYDHLLAHFGKSDLGGRIVTSTVNDRPHLDADVQARWLQLADFGKHAADGRPIQSDKKKFLLSDANLPIGVLRARDASIKLRADTLVAGPLQLQSLSADAQVEKSVLTVPVLTATFKQSQVKATLRTDATHEQPITDLEIRVAGLELEQFGKPGRKPPFAGPLQAHVHVVGQGTSLHGLASTANGTLAAVLPRGAMRASLADAAGVSLRSLGLMLSGDQETPVRCGLAHFKAENGKLNGEHLLIDTEPVLIAGSGGIDLATETLDLQLNGHPKKLRLGRLRTPLYVQGPVAHPSFSMDRSRLLGQAGAAVAIGLAVTPVAAVLALVDPGLAKDADCATLISQVR